MNESLFTRDHDETVAAPSARSIRRARRPESIRSAPTVITARRRSRRLGPLAGAVLLAVLVSGCGAWSQWVPDFNGDGRLTQDEADRQAQAIAATVEAGRRTTQNHPFLTCVRAHESDRGPAPHINGYGAQNPASSASGAYQFLDSTWQNVSVRSGHPGYGRAAQAPWYVQDAVALWLYNNGGRSAWNGSGC